MNAGAAYFGDGLHTSPMTTREHIKKEAREWPSEDQRYRSVAKDGRVSCSYALTKRWQHSAQRRFCCLDIAFAGLKPDLISYNALISAFEKGVQHEQAEHTFRMMQAKGITPDVVTYSAMVSVYEKARRWQTALQVFAEMRQQGIEPNVLTWSAAISACGRVGQWVQAFELFRSMLAYGVEPNVVTYTALIDSYEKEGLWQRALEAWQVHVAVSFLLPGLDPRTGGGA